jgi:DNA-directed RNA polymerase subunit RPC12/RpoP
MVSNEEIKRRLELRRKGIDPEEESHLKEEVPRNPIKHDPPVKKTIDCPECGTMNLESSKFCIGCGNPLSKKEMVEVKSEPFVCPECGTENATTSKFCIGCGKNLNESPEEGFLEETKESVEIEQDIQPVQEEEVLEEKEEYPIEKIDESKKDDFFEEIKKAKELLDIGAITEEEFEKIKNKYLKQFE